MLTVREIMTPSPVCVHPETLLKEVIGVMKQKGCRQLPVVDEAGDLVGIITDRDVRLVLNSPLTLRDRKDDIHLLNTVTALACMTPDPETVEPNTPAIRAAEILLLHKFGALPVVEDNHVVGIITVSDILKSYIDLLKQAERIEA